MKSEKSTLSESNLESKYPNIAKYWHPTKNGDLKPEDVAPKSNKKVWWTCEKEHAYQRSADQQIKCKAMCPICNGRRLVQGINDVKTLYPQIAKEWDYEKNAPDKPEDYTFVSVQKKWWKCKVCKNVWKATIKCRCVKGNGCPSCARKKVWKKRFETMDVGITDPELLEEWDYELNGDLTPDKIKPGSSIKVAWRCPKCGKRYKATPYSRTGKKPRGCPDCGIKKNAAMRYRAVKMIDLETGEVLREFSSVTEASKEMSISSGNISAVCKKNTGRTQAGGYGWKYK